MRNDFKVALQRALELKELNVSHIMILLNALPGEEEKALFSLADKVREEVVGDEIHLRGLIEFSNYCFRDCLYCGHRKSNKKIQRYRMGVHDIIQVAIDASNLGYKTIVLQSGEDPYYTVDMLCKAIRGIKEKADVAVTLCLGEREYQEYRYLKEAGADRYLLKIETTDKTLYSHIHPGMSYEKRLESLMSLGELGYQIGSGNILGLPGQSIKSIAEDILFFKEQNFDMVGIGPFIANPNTPFGREPNGTVDITLKVLAVTRLLLPYAHIPATTAIGSLDPRGKQKALSVGANVIMPNVTPVEYRLKYEIYPNKICVNEELGQCRHCIEGIITSLGRRVGKDYGHSLKII